MIRDFADVRDDDLVRAEVVVVGSGAAGIALALSLGAANRRVLLLESGGDRTPDPADPLNEGTTGVLAYEGLLAGRGRALGGTTTLWHGQCMRLHPIDFEPRAWLERSGWPITLADLDPYYADAERFLGVSGRGYGDARWAEHPALPPLGWDSSRLEHDFTEYTPQPSLVRTYRSRLRRSRQVTVLHGATVGGIEVRDGSVVALDVYGAAGRRSRLTTRNVVLAGGTIENARLLQLSDPAGQGLGTGRAHTGRFLQDHPIIRTAEVFPHDHRVLQERYVALHAGRHRLFPKVRLAERAQREARLLDATAVFVHEYDDQGVEAARRLVLAARRRERPTDAGRDLIAAAHSARPVLRTAFRRRVLHRATAERPSRVWLQLWLEQAPESDRRIRLGEQRDAFGLRRAHVDWTCSDLELETSRQLTRFVTADLERLGIASVRELAAMTDDAAWRASVIDAAHPAGTTRMARSPLDGVVDPDLAVHGIQGLSVVGGSVFPTSGYANPTLTIVALALRLADHLVVGFSAGRG